MYTCVRLERTRARRVEDVYRTGAVTVYSATVSGARSENGWASESLKTATSPYHRLTRPSDGGVYNGQGTRFCFGLVPQDNEEGIVVDA